MDSVSCEKLITDTTAPCFIWHTWEDKGVDVENSMVFAFELRKHKVSFELHIYTKGGHGLGLGADFQWEVDCVRWLKEMLLQ